jgi:hypothetical protein
VVDQAPLQLQREMALGTAHQDGLEELTEGLVGDLRADAQTGDLLLVLDDPQLFDGAPQVGQAQPRRDGAEGAVPGDGEVVFLDGEGVGVLSDGQAGGSDGGVASGGGQDVQPQGVVGAPLEGAVVRRGRADQEVLVSAQEQDGSLWGGAGEIAHVRWARDEGCRAAGRVAAFPQFVAAGCVHL